MLKRKLSTVSVGIAVAVALLLMVIGCGPSTQQPVDSPAGGQSGGAQGQQLESGAKAALDVAKARGGKFIASSGVDIAIDPHLYVAGGTTTFPSTNQIIARDIYDPKYPIVPDLAKSWEMSKDGKSYTFKFHQGVKFQNVPPVNGREFTSEDAKYNIMRIMADPSLVTDNLKPRFQRRSEFPKLSMETPDKYTLVMKLEEPYAPVLDALTYVTSVILPREFIEKFPEKIITEGIIGTGPFIQGEFRLGQFAAYKKNPDYWRKDSQGGQLPYLDAVDFVQFADPSAAAAAFRARQVDVFQPTKTNMDVLQREMPNAKAFIGPQTNYTHMRINVTAKPFDDVRVRRAIHLAVDRQQFKELFGEDITPISGPVSSPVYPDFADMDWLMSQPGYRQPKDQDIAEAKRLMKEAGYENGLTFEFLTIPTYTDFVALFQEQLKPLNITMKVQVMDYQGQLVPRVLNGEFQMQTAFGNIIGTDVDSVLAVNFGTGASRNAGKYSNAAFDDLVKKEQRAVTLEERKKYVREAEKLLLEDAPAIWLQTKAQLLLAQPWVHNASMGLVNQSYSKMHEYVWLEKH